MSRRFWIVVALIAAFCIAQLIAYEDAHAYDATNTPEGVKLANLAYQAWHQMPNCPQGYHLYIEPITDQPAVVDGTGGPAAGEADIPGCWMRLVPEYWADNSSLLSRWNESNLCAIYIHEYGHSLGYPHTTDHDSVMNPLTEFTTGKPKVCQEIEEVPTPITYEKPTVEEVTSNVSAPRVSVYHHRHHRHHRRHRRHRHVSHHHSRRTNP